MELPTSDDLRERRNTLELTQSELADRAGVSQPLIARIEGGDVDPRLSTLRDIVNALEEAESGVLRAADIMNENVDSVAPDDSVREAVSEMLDHGYSQVPVLDGEAIQGILSTADVRHHDSDQTADLPVAEVMHSSYATVEPDATLDEIDHLLNHNDAVLVTDGPRFVGIVTEADVTASLF